MKTRTVSLLLCSFLLCGCQQQLAAGKHPDYVELEVLKRSGQCRIGQPALRELHSLDEIRELVAPATMLAVDQPLPQVDFSSHIVMLLAMGQKPSSGYRIEIDAGRIENRQGTVRLPVSFTNPGDSIVATVITSPCVILSLDRAGVRRIIAGDTGLSIQP